MELLWNQEAMEQQGRMLEHCTDVLRRGEQTGFSPVVAFAMARASHVAVECIVDMGIRVIDALHLRDPGGYWDVVDILTEAEFLPPSLARQLQEPFAWRQRLVRSYADMTVEEMWNHRLSAALCNEVSRVFHTNTQRLCQRNI